MWPWPIVAGLLLGGLAGDDFADHMRLGIEETKQGACANAMVDLQAANRLKPDSPQVYFRLGLLLGQMADFRAAETAFRTTIKLDPCFAEAHYNLGLTLIANPQSKLDWPAAIASFRDALKCRPDYAEAFNYLGVGLMATGDLDAAITALERAALLNLALAEAHFNLALALEKKERAPDAEAQYRLAIEARHGTYPEASTALGKLLFHLGRVEAGEQALLTALRADPDLSDAHYALAQLLQSKKQSAAAETEFEQVRDLAKRKADAMQSSRLTNEGLQAAAKGDMRLALQSEREAVLLKPDFGLPHLNLALILADTGAFAEAASELIKAASLLPASAAPWFDLGRVLFKEGDFKGAVAALMWSARLAPADARIPALLKEIKAAAKGDPPVSVSAPPFGPSSDTAAAHYGFAMELVKTEDYLGAVGELLRTLALEPANEKARRRLADNYRRLKLTHEATLQQARADLTTNVK